MGVMWYSYTHLLHTIAATCRTRSLPLPPTQLPGYRSTSCPVKCMRLPPSPPSILLLIEVQTRPCVDPGITINWDPRGPGHARNSGKFVDKGAVRIRMTTPAPNLRPATSDLRTVWKQDLWLVKITVYMEE
ncbi:hypothetical protein J6590_015228 [Homalodisca vitripennis]|nr:hypothetical protein J6590_015228 [Homalodisca vitripennis]